MEILFSPLFFFLPVINDNLEPANTLNIDDRVNDAEQKTGHRLKPCFLATIFLLPSFNIPETQRSIGSWDIDSYT